jgi:hypothetical protein
MKTELCPFCKGDADPRHGIGGIWHVECNKRDCRALGPDGDTAEEAVEKWNKRPEQQGEIVNYAEGYWTVEDMKCIKPGWTEQQCIDWLKEHEEKLQEAATKGGWSYVEDVLDGPLWGA